MKSNSKTKPFPGVRRQTAGQKAAKMVRQAKAKAKRIEARSIVREARHKANLKRGGVRGALARKIEKVNTKAKATNELEALKPKLYEKERTTTIKTDAEVKKTKAKGAALAGVASALGAAYSTGKEADARKEAYKTAGIEAQAKALEAGLGSIPNVDEDGKSVSGLVTGVR